MKYKPASLTMDQENKQDGLKILLNGSANFQQTHNDTFCQSIDFLGNNIGTQKILKFPAPQLRSQIKLPMDYGKWHH